MVDLTLLKVLEFFMENPYQEVYLRQLANIVKLSVFSTKKYADLLLKKDLIKEERKANLRYFRANLNSVFFKQLKIAFSIDLLVSSRLVDFLKENMSNVSSIVLFGSVAKGEDDKKSDVDILVIGKEKYLDVSKFEKSIGKPVTIHTFNWAEWNQQSTKNKAFYSEIISYGIPLFGELPLVDTKK